MLTCGRILFSLPLTKPTADSCSCCLSTPASQHRTGGTDRHRAVIMTGSSANHGRERRHQGILCADIDPEAVGHALQSTIASGHRCLIDPGAPEPIRCPQDDGHRPPTCPVGGVFWHRAHSEHQVRRLRNHLEAAIGISIPPGTSAVNRLLVKVAPRFPQSSPDLTP
jgi:hypothetical protein